MLVTCIFSFSKNVTFGRVINTSVNCISVIREATLRRHIQYDHNEDDLDDEDDDISLDDDRDRDYKPSAIEIQVG